MLQSIFVLPVPPNKARLKSFWLVVSASVFLALLIVPLFRIPFSPGWLVPATISTAIVALPGILRPSLVTLPYRAFNKAARLMASLLSEWIMFICFGAVTVAAGRKWDWLMASPPSTNASHWIARNGGNLDENGSITIVDGDETDWLTPFLKWIRRTGNWTMYLLLPYMHLLSAIQREQESLDVPDNVYTLY